MRRLLASLVAALTLIPAAALACEGQPHEGHEAAAAAKPKTVALADAMSLQRDNKATFVDANGAEFRQKNGVIPGALLLTGGAYDPAKELPAAKDSALVFYCAATRCNASHAAALKAVTAGWKDVSVMPDGLLGWKAGKGKTVEPSKANRPQT